MKKSMVAHTYNPNTWEAKAGGLQINKVIESMAITLIMSNDRAIIKSHNKTYIVE